MLWIASETARDRARAGGHRETGLVEPDKSASAFREPHSCQALRPGEPLAGIRTGFATGDDRKNGSADEARRSTTMAVEPRPSRFDIVDGMYDAYVVHIEQPRVGRRRTGGLRTAAPPRPPSGRPSSTRPGDPSNLHEEVHDANAKGPRNQGLQGVAAEPEPAGARGAVAVGLPGQARWGQSLMCFTHMSSLMRRRMRVACDCGRDAAGERRVSLRHRRAS